LGSAGPRARGCRVRGRGRARVGRERRARRGHGGGGRARGCRAPTRSMRPSASSRSPRPRSGTPHAAAMASKVAMTSAAVCGSRLTMVDGLPRPSTRPSAATSFDEKAQTSHRACVSTYVSPRRAGAACFDAVTPRRSPASTQTAALEASSTTGVPLQFQLYGTPDAGPHHRRREVAHRHGVDGVERELGGQRGLDGGVDGALRPVNHRRRRHASDATREQTGEAVGVGAGVALVRHGDDLRAEAEAANDLRRRRE
jgi:hypothetical protein